jgi:hypothetical protein
MATKKKNPAAVSLGRLGGKARAEKLSPEEKAEISRKGAVKRWSQPKASEAASAAAARLTPEQRKERAQKAAAARWGAKKAAAAKKVGKKNDRG